MMLKDQNKAAETTNKKSKTTTTIIHIIDSYHRKIAHYHLEHQEAQVSEADHWARSAGVTSQANLVRYFSFSICRHGRARWRVPCLRFSRPSSGPPSGVISALLFKEKGRRARNKACSATRGIY